MLKKYIEMSSMPNLIAHKDISGINQYFNDQRLTRQQHNCKARIAIQDVLSLLEPSRQVMC